MFSHRSGETSYLPCDGGLDTLLARRLPSRLFQNPAAAAWPPSRWRYKFNLVKVYAVGLYIPGEAVKEVPLKSRAAPAAEPRAGRRGKEHCTVGSSWNTMFRYDGTTQVY